MVRLAVTPASVVGPFLTGQPAADSLDIVFTGPAVASDGISFPLTGREIVVVRNIHATLPQTVTFSATADPFGRTQDVTAYSLGAGEFMAFKFSDLIGFRQSDGNVYAVGSTTDIKFAVLRY
jgi:hypothetical protein